VEMQQQQLQQQPIKIPHPKASSSASLLYPGVKKEVEQQFLGRGVTLEQEKPALYFSECKQLRKSSCSASCLALSCGWGHAKLSLSLSTIVLMSNSHRLLIIHSPHFSSPLLPLHHRTCPPMLQVLKLQQLPSCILRHNPNSRQPPGEHL
jgi:hypothetical protein